MVDQPAGKQSRLTQKGRATSSRSTPATAMRQTAQPIKGMGQEQPLPPPLVVFDPEGRPARISYDLPESMSYQGRRLVDFGFRYDEFAELLLAVEDGNNPSLRHLQWMRPTEDGPSAPASDPSTVISAPQAVVLTTSGADPAAKVMHAPSAPFPLTERLADLSWGDVIEIGKAGKHLDILRLVGGPLDYRVRAAPDMPKVAPPTIDGQPTSLRLAALVKGGEGGGGGNGGAPIEPPSLEVVIDSPDHSNPSIVGPVEVTVVGATTWYHTSVPSVTIQLDNQDPVEVPLTDKQLTGVANFKYRVTLTKSKQYRITAQSAAIKNYGPYPREISSRDTVTVSVTLPEKSKPTQIAPTVRIVEPKPNSTIIAPAKRAVVTLSGTVDDNGGSAGLIVTVAASGSPNPDAHPDLHEGKWSQVVELRGLREHVIDVTCVNSANIAAPIQSVRVTLIASQVMHPIDRRLFLVETVRISSFLGDYGAGRLLKTLSLLPGERTTISIESYRREEATAKTAQSILDSTASECSADFENTLSTEQNRKANDASSNSFSLSAEASASFGYGSAKVNASTSAASNSSREEMAKDVSGAIEKHASKASTNREVNVNTEFSSTSATGTTESIKREFQNINVSRVLNFVFRQMVQEHIVLLHLVDARIGYYTQDVVLDGQGAAKEVRETYQEYTLPEFGDLAAHVLKGGYGAAEKAQDALEESLRSVADANGNLLSLVEEVVPLRDGVPQPLERYLRVNPRLHTKWQPRGDTGPTFEVPGIILSQNQIIMRTDGVLVDSILGEGDALDEYSHGLQDATVGERQAAVSRELLAQEIVRNKDADMAALFVQLFPPPPVAKKDD